MSGLVIRRSPVTSSVIERVTPTGLSKAREALSGAGGGGGPATTPLITISAYGPTSFNTGLKVGTRFTAQENFTLSGVWAYIKTAGTYPFQLWQATGGYVKLAQIEAEVVTDSPTLVTFDTPVDLVSGNQYVSCIYAAGGFTYYYSPTVSTVDPRIVDNGFGSSFIDNIDAAPSSSGTPLSGIVIPAVA